MSKLGETLIKKLSKEELGLLCDSFDDGSLGEIIYEELLPVDVKNFPEKYKTIATDSDEVEG